jgi:low affinity Fe/Cu permease
VIDRPARGSGRAYLVECGLEHDGYRTLKALIDDYTREAGEHDEIPMLVRLCERHAARGRAG